jgi:transcription elongation factor Elf1
MMPKQIIWRTEEPCPSCDAEMVLLDAGLPVVLAECRACGYRETWDAEPETTGDDAW